MKLYIYCSIYYTDGLKIPINRPWSNANFKCMNVRVNYHDSIDNQITKIKKDETDITYFFNEHDDPFWNEFTFSGYY